MNQSDKAIGSPWGIALAVLAVLAAAGGLFLSCDNLFGNNDKKSVTYTVTASGGADTNAIVFTFNGFVSSLTADQITLTDGTGSATKGTLSGSGTTWTLGVIVAAEGSVSVSINKSGIESGTKTVTVAKAAAVSGITYTVTADNATDTTAIVFAFSEDVSGLTADMITLTDGTGSVTKGALTGSGTSWKLDVTVGTAGFVKAIISKIGVAGGTKTLRVYKGGSGGDIDYDVISSGGSNTNAIVFTFSEAASGLTADDITLADGTGSAIKGALAGSGISWKLGVTAARAGTVTVSVNKAGITSGAKTVTVSRAGSGGGDITYYIRTDGSANLTRLEFIFSEAASGLTANDIILTDGTGSAVKGAIWEGGEGRYWTLDITVGTEGTITVFIDKAGIESGEKTVAVYKGMGNGSWTVYPYKLVDETTLKFNPMGQGDGKRPYTPDDPECPEYNRDLNSGYNFPMGKWNSKNNGERNLGNQFSKFVEYIDFGAEEYTWCNSSSIKGLYIRSGDSVSGVIKSGGWEYPFRFEGGKLIFNPMLRGDGMGVYYTPDDPECPVFVRVKGAGDTVLVGEWVLENENYRVVFDEDTMDKGWKNEYSGWYAADPVNQTIRLERR